eukprot:scpid51868/ scgid31907/ Arsenite methyltransferase; Methylarsonite methyltransferase; S-adenosyl-L-methionine:arsenic(III) methyltransferase
MSCGSSETRASCCGGGSSSQDQINPNSATEVYDSVKDYYGKRLQGSDDLKTSACTTGASAMPRYIRQAIAEVHDEVVKRYYGCGLVVPQLLQDAHVLDLGSGAGRDCFVVSKLVGEKGKVVGVDMTEEQLQVARQHIEYHRDKFGLSKSNVEFRHGYIEKLGEAGLEDGTFDVIMSNCVINLVPDKEAVLRESYRVLRDGGELYFSDVYSSAIVPDDLRKDAVLWGECISGALYWEDLISLAKKVGFATPRLVRAAPIDMNTEEMQAKLGDLRFVSATYRLVKVPVSEQEAKSQKVTYNGGALNNPDELEFDQTVSFPAQTAVTVSAAVTAILRSSRFARYLSFADAPCCAPTPADPDLNPFVLSDRTPAAAASGGGCCGGGTGSRTDKDSTGCGPPAKKSCC